MDITPKVPVLIECAQLYVQKSGVTADSFEPPNGRPETPACNLDVLCQPCWSRFGSDLKTALVPPRYIIASDCSGLGTLSYCMSCSQTLTSSRELGAAHCLEIFIRHFADSRVEGRDLPIHACQVGPLQCHWDIVPRGCRLRPDKGCAEVAVGKLCWQLAKFAQ